MTKLPATVFGQTKKKLFVCGIYIADIHTFIYFETAIHELLLLVQYAIGTRAVKST